MAETIGGAASGGGIPIADDDSRAGLAGGGGAIETLLVKNLDLANAIFAGMGLLKVAGISYAWFVKF